MTPLLTQLDELHRKAMFDTKYWDEAAKDFETVAINSWPAISAAIRAADAYLKFRDEIQTYPFQGQKVLAAQEADKYLELYRLARAKLEGKSE